MKVLLIANNPAAQAPSAGYDLYVHFNVAIHWGATPPGQSIIAVRKSIHVVKARSFRCYPNTLACGTIMAIGWRRDLEAFFLRFPNDRRDIIDVAEAPCPPKQAPTSGWAALHHYLKRDYQVTVCGFDLKAAGSDYTRGLHNINFEAEQLEILVNDGKIKRI